MPALRQSAKALPPRKKITSVKKLEKLKRKEGMKRN
jgi:hypothetical protein